VDPASIALALVAAQIGQARLGVAEKMMKNNADQQSSVAQMLATAAQAASQQASLPAGVGGNLDIAA
jgi:hypothetical protein